MKALVCLLGVLLLCSFGGAKSQSVASQGHSKTRLTRGVPMTYKICSKQSLFTLSGDVKIEQLNKRTFHFSANFDSREDVNGGKIDVEVAKSSPPLKRKFNFNLCEELPNGCPVTKGRNQISLRRELPNYIPKGKYRVSVKARDDKQRELFCVNAEITI